MARIPFAETPELPPVNIFKVLGHRMDLLEKYRDYGQHLVTQGEIEPRLTELVVTSVAATLGSDYLWSHHSDMARENGVSDDELRAVRDSRLDVLEARDQACVSYAQRLEQGSVADGDIEALVSAGLEPSEIVELTLLASFYGMTARMLDALDVRLEDGRAGLEHP